MNFLRYIRTLRYLRREQIVGQVRVRIQQRVRDPARILAKAPPLFRLPSSDLRLSSSFPPPVPGQDPAEVAAGRFSFIGQTADLGASPDWGAPGLPRLWAYNLHYFDWLWSLLPEEGPDWESAKRLVLDWIERHPPGRGACGWEPYPTSLRLMNWALLFGVRHRTRTEADPEFSQRLLESIEKQVRWLEMNLETHIQANHLLENLAALACVYSVFKRKITTRFARRSAAARRWCSDSKSRREPSYGCPPGDEKDKHGEHGEGKEKLEDGSGNRSAPCSVFSASSVVEESYPNSKVVAFLKREVREQILPDGMHYERSPMYHLRMLWLVEMLEEIGSPEVKECVAGVDERMQAALACLRHPDAEIAQFNDAAIGIYHDGWKMGDAATGSWALPVAGYYGFRDGRGNYLIVDAGPVGPDHQPGHAHADFLSFELSLGGRRVITDTGVGTYDAGAQRAYDRSTAAHSTVEIDGENSVEVWGSFRVGRRTVPRVIAAGGTGEGFSLTAEHDGYAHLPCGAVHRRSFRWENGVLNIRDRVSVTRAVEAVSRFHLAPGVNPTVDGRRVVWAVEGMEFWLGVDGPGEIALEETPSFAEFGQERKRTTVVMRTIVTPPFAEWTVLIREVEG